MDELKEEVERLRNLLYVNYLLHNQLHNLTQGKKDLLGVTIIRQGYIDEKGINTVLRMWHNIPKEDCPLIIKGMEILGLIEKENKEYKINPPKESIEDVRFKYKKKLGLLDFNI